MYNIKTLVKFDLGYNPLIFDGVMGLFYFLKDFIDSILV